MARRSITNPWQASLGLVLLLAVLAGVMFCPCALGGDVEGCACSSSCCDANVALHSTSLPWHNQIPQGEALSDGLQVTHPGFVSGLLRPPRI
jgi:hypothetical protein